LFLFSFFFFFLRSPDGAQRNPGDSSEADNIAPGYRFAHPGYVLAPSVIEPKPVLPPGLKNSA
jgi:hypothetical protein